MSTTGGGERVSAGGGVLQRADSCPKNSRCGWRLRGAMGLKSRECAAVLSGCVLVVEAGWVWVVVG